MISFVIPTLNEERTLEATLCNLTRYSGDHEIIVSDGNSSDATREIAQRYTNNIAVYAGLERQTIAMGRNAGAALASGEFIVSMDADVTIPAIDDFFEKATSFFAANRTVVAMTVEYRVLPEQETLSDRAIFWCLGMLFRFENNVLHLGGSGGEFQMIRTRAFRQVGGFNEKLAAAEDVDLFMRLAKIGRTWYEPSLFVYHTGRRAHKIGWPKLLWQWLTNSLRLVFGSERAPGFWEEIR